jgi:phenylpyruvate tautomerase PptA (4-oxalocrotonate tautomerase family)
MNTHKSRKTCVVKGVSLLMVRMFSAAKSSIHVLTAVM